MASSRPRLQVSGLPSVSENEASSTASPARGRETKNVLLSKLRPPATVHAWDFWHEKAPDANSANANGNSNANSATITTSPESSTDPSSTNPPVQPNFERQTSTSSITSIAPTTYNTNLSLLTSVTDIKSYWSLMNNFSFSSLPPKTSMHLFHKSVLPIWEHPRNALGGSWTFRLSANQASTFFRALSLLAIGEQLQEAVSDPSKTVFRDDICGISYVVKSTTSVNVSVWNRDGENEDGIQRLLETIRNEMPEGLKPKEQSTNTGMGNFTLGGAAGSNSTVGTSGGITGFYYKKHRDHAGYSKEKEKSYIAAQEMEAKRVEQKMEEMHLRASHEIPEPKTRAEAAAEKKEEERKIEENQAESAEKSVDEKVDDQVAEKDVDVPAA